MILQQHIKNCDHIMFGHRATTQNKQAAILGKFLPFYPAGGFKN